MYSKEEQTLFVLQKKGEGLRSFLNTCDIINAYNIVRPNSYDIPYLVEVFHNQRIKVFADVNGYITRTEIYLYNGNSVFVYKDFNYNQVNRLDLSIPRFSHIEIFSPYHNLQKRIEIQMCEHASLTNPLYMFYDEGRKLGEGWGQHLDIYIGKKLLNIGSKISQATDSLVSSSVVNAIAHTNQ